MGDTASGKTGGARRGTPAPKGSSVLTPPSGVPVTPDPTASELTGLVPAQRSPEDLRPPAPPATVVEPCSCGHARAAHEHYRPGKDCGACGAEACSSYRPEGGPVRKALRKMHLAG
jgi:hypothetical protein